MISGEIPLNKVIPRKKDEINGKIPPISSKKKKMDHFTLLNRKNSAYIPQNQALFFV